MPRRERFAGRIDREQLEGIDRQPGLPRNRLVDIPLKTVRVIDVRADRVLSPPLLPRRDIPDIPDIPLIEPGIPQRPYGKIVSDGFQPILKTFGIEQTKPITLYILIGAVCLVGFIALRR